jgi:hypothetical protein
VPLALVKGNVRYHPARNNVLCLERTHTDKTPSERWLVALNFSDAPRELAAPLWRARCCPLGNILLASGNKLPELT